MGTMVCRFATTHRHNNISVIISRPRHPFYRQLIDCTVEIQKCNKKRQDLLHQEFGTNLIDSLFPTLGDIQAKYSDIVGFPYKTFYPYSIFNLEELYQMRKMENIDEGVVAVHWFNGHKLSKEYINNEEESIKRNCTMSKLIYLIKNKLL
jgi:hypothetical protein